MSANIFFISDTHFGHEKCWSTFKRDDGVTPMRPFSSTEEMDETMIERWNAVVRPQDHVYHLGDVVIKRKHLPICGRLNGHKRLVRGNHDLFKTREYIAYFDEVWGVRVLNDIIFSHIPLHPESVKARWLGNVHGHLHHRRMDDPRYLNVSVEQTDYTPISMDEVVRRLKAQQSDPTPPSSTLQRTLKDSS